MNSYEFQQGKAVNVKVQDGGGVSAYKLSWTWNTKLKNSKNDFLACILFDFVLKASY